MEIGWPVLPFLYALNDMRTVCQGCIECIPLRLQLTSLYTLHSLNGRGEDVHCFRFGVDSKWCTMYNVHAIVEW